MQDGASDKAGSQGEDGIIFRAYTGIEEKEMKR